MELEEQLQAHRARSAARWSDRERQIRHHVGGIDLAARQGQDLAVLGPEEGTNELVVQALHPGATRGQVVEATGWDVRFADTVDQTPPPTQEELTVLRDLHRRSLRAHHA